MNFDRLIEISRALKGKNQTGRAFHCSFALLKKKIIGIGVNSYFKTHTLTKNYKAYKINNANYTAGTHSEISLLGKLGIGFDFSNITLVNIRIRNDDKLGLSRPCLGCLGILKFIEYKKFYYSTNEEKFELL